MTHRRIMPFGEWPLADRQLFDRARRQGDILDEEGPAARWSAKTVRNDIKFYGMWLQYLANRNLLTPDSLPSARLTRYEVRGYTSELRGRLAEASVVGRLSSLRRMIAAMEPGYRNAFIAELIKRLRRRMKPGRNKLARLRNPSEILKAVIRAMRHEQLVVEASGRKSLTRYRTALIIAVLTTVPLRLGNIRSLKLGTNLIRNGDGFDLYVPGEQAKNGRPYCGIVARELVFFLEYYLDNIRPRLLGEIDNDAVWVTYRYGMISEQSVYLTVTQMTQEMFGQPIYPHLFRDIAATWFAVNDPAHVRAASTVLGHSSMRTGEKHYNQAKMLDAVRQFQKGSMAAKDTR